MIISSGSSSKIIEKIVAKVMDYSLPEKFSFSPPRIIAENGRWFVGASYEDNNKIFVIGIADEPLPSQESARLCAEAVREVLIERGGEQI